VTLWPFLLFLLIINIQAIDEAAAKRTSSIPAREIAEPDNTTT
jgi:hypothetical protein